MELFWYILVFVLLCILSTCVFSFYIYVKKATSLSLSVYQWNWNFFSGGTPLETKCFLISVYNSPKQFRIFLKLFGCAFRIFLEHFTKLFKKSDAVLVQF